MNQILINAGLIHPDKSNSLKELLNRHTETIPLGEGGEGIDRSEAQK